MTGGDGSAPAAAAAAAAAARARWAVLAIFAANGFVFANWVPRIAEVRSAVGAGEAEMGLALLAVAAGALSSMSVIGLVVDRFGSRRVIAAALVVYPASLVGLGLVGTLPALGAALYAFGASNGALDVAMNVRGAEVERRLGRPVFSSFHGAFSLGVMAGAAAAGVLAAAGLTPLAHFALAAAAASAGGLAAAWLLGPDDERREREDGEATSGRRRASPAFLLGGVAFCALLAEGSIADWGAIFLADHRGAGPDLAAAAFAAFAGAMAAGRLAGDRAVARLGRGRVVAGGGAVAAAGLLLAIAVPAVPAAIVGFALCGVGVACVFPVALNTAAAASPAGPGAAIAAVSTVGYLGFLAGPPAIGLVAELLGLPASLALVAALLLAIVPAGRTVERLARGDHRPPPAGCRPPPAPVPSADSTREETWRPESAPTAPT